MDKIDEGFKQAAKIYLVRRFFEDGNYFESNPLTSEQAEIEVCNECLHNKCKLNDLIGEHGFGYEHFVGVAYKLYVNAFDSPEDFKKVVGYYI